MAPFHSFTAWFLPRRMLLLVGVLAAACNLVGWALVDLDRYGFVTAHGSRNALFVLSATLALYLVLRLALLVTRQDAA